MMTLARAVDYNSCRDTLEKMSVERLVEGDCVLKHIRHIIIFERLPIVERLVEGGCVLSSERGEREKRFYGDGKGERRRTAS